MHTSRIFLNSQIYAKLLHNQLDGILLGESGYRLLPFFLAAETNPKNEEENWFNSCHNSTSVPVEMALRQLKRRFACLERKMRIKLDRVATTVTACCILHNLCKDLRDADECGVPDAMDAGGETIECDAGHDGDIGLRRAGERVRDEIAQYLLQM